MLQCVHAWVVPVKHYKHECLNPGLTKISPSRRRGSGVSPLTTSRATAASWATTRDGYGAGHTEGEGADDTASGIKGIGGVNRRARSRPGAAMEEVRPPREARKPSWKPRGKSQAHASTGPSRSKPNLRRPSNPRQPYNADYHRPSGEWNRGKQITSFLRNAGDEGGHHGIMEVVTSHLSELNSVHCTMVLNRLSKTPPSERDTVLQSSGFGTLMERVEQVMEQFSNRDIAQAAISLARFRDPRRMGQWQGLIRALQDKAKMSLTEMTTKELAMIVNAFANLPEPPGPAYWDAFSQVFLEKASDFDKQGLSMVINGMSKILYRPPPEVLHAVEALTLDLMETCNTQELANILNGFGKLDHVPSSDYLARFELLSQPKLPQFQPQELSMTFNAMSRIGYRPSDSYLQAFEAACIQALPQFKTQESAMTINAFTKMVDFVPSPAFFAEVERCVIQKAGQHRAQEVANTIHGLGRLGYDPSPRFVEAFAEHGMVLMDKMKTQELGNLINGLSKMTYRPAPAFFLRFMDVSQPKLRYFTTQELSNVVNGLMRLGCKPDEEYLRATVQMAARHLSEYKEQELACLFHAYGRMLFFPGTGFMEAYEMEFGRRVASGVNSQALAMTLNAFNRLNWKPSPRLLLEMEKSLECATCEGLIFGAELAQAVNGLANLNHTPGRSFLAAFKNVILEQKNYVDLSTIAVILWSLSALDPARMKGFYTEMVEVACRRLEGEQPDILPTSFSGERSSMYYTSFNEVVPTIGGESLEPPMVMCVRQLLQTCRYLTMLANPIDPALFQRFSSLLEKKWAEIQREKYEVHTSYFHRDVLAVVTKSLGLRCDIEVEDEAYTLDMVMYPTDGGLPVVVEADGPHHFFRNQPDEAMGFTVFKHRLLQGRSDRWRAVVSVSQAEWQRAKESDSQRGRTALLIEKLRGAGLDLEEVTEAVVDPPI